MSLDEGENWFQLYAAGGMPYFDPGFGDTSWVIPDTVGERATASTLCILRVWDYVEPTLRDESDGTFTILSRLGLLSPSAGEAHASSEELVVSWAVRSVQTVRCAVGFSVDSGQAWVEVPGSPFAIDSTGTWTVSFVPDSLFSEGVNSPNCFVRVVDPDNGWSAVSEGAFTVAPTAEEKDDGCGCGSGTAVALLPPLGFRIARRLKRRRKPPRAA
jgi:hypothetical protein